MLFIIHIDSTKVVTLIVRGIILVLLPGIISKLVACNEKDAMRHLAINQP